VWGAKSGGLPCFDRSFNPFGVGRLFQIWEQFAQTSVVQFGGRGPETMHLEYFTHEWVEKAEHTQHQFGGRADASLLTNGGKDEINEFCGL
jgi:hypothetical protein